MTDPICYRCENEYETDEQGRPIRMKWDGSLFRFICPKCKLELDPGDVDDIPWLD